MTETEQYPQIPELNETRENDIICRMHAIYSDIEKKQSVWKDASKLSCPDGCGICCHHFEPDVCEGEALYIAAWMIINQKETAEKIADGTFVSPHADEADGCFLFNPDSKYHCTVYGGRMLICRLFGFSGDYGKDGFLRWKPCHFMPDEALEKCNMEHKQYSAEEMRSLFQGLPPAMSDCVQQAIALAPSGNRPEQEPLRDALPAAIKKILMLIAFNTNGSNNDDDNNTPMSA